MTGVYLDPSDATIAHLIERQFDGPVTMLNLLRFRDVADYSADPHLRPPQPITGSEAFDRYIAHTLPFLEASGGSLTLLADGGHVFIGPPDERWDLVMLVRQASIESFVAFADDPAYLAGLGHRTAALTDSRLLPMVERALPAGVSTASGDDVLTVSGRAGYRERIALLPGSVLTVTLQDVSRADAPSTILARQVIELDDRNVPVDFELRVDRGELHDRGRYVVRAVIENAAGKLVFTTDTAHPVDVGRNSVDLGTLTLIRAG